MFWKRKNIFSRCCKEVPLRKKRMDKGKATHLYWLHYQTEQKKPWKSQIDYIVQTVTTTSRDLQERVDTVKSALDVEREARADLEHQILLRFDEGRRRQAVLEQQISDLSRKFVDGNKQILEKFTEMKYYFDKNSQK